MSFFGLKVEHQCARLLGQIDVPGNKTPLDEMHVTVVYIGESTSISTATKIISSVYKVTTKRTPFTLKVNKVTSFPTKTEQGYPIIAKVMSPELHEFYTDVTASLDKNGIGYSKKYPEYKPHVTLAYSDEPIGTITLENPIEWAAHEAMLWMSDKGDDKLNANFPFTVGPCKKSRKCKL